MIILQYIYSECFSERAQDREEIVQFKVPTCTNEELKQGREKYERAINTKQVLYLVLFLCLHIIFTKISIGVTMMYSRFVLSPGMTPNILISFI